MSRADADARRISTDPDAFEAFYRSHLPWVRSYVARRVQDAATAADLTADIFVTVIDVDRAGRPESVPERAWLAGVARNVVAMHHRRRGRELAASGRLVGRALLDESSIDRIAERIDAERAVGEVLSRLSLLPATQRAVVELVAVDGLTLVEAAHVLGITPTNARVRFHRARTRLQLDLPRPLEVTP